MQIKKKQFPGIMFHFSVRDGREIAILYLSQLARVIQECSGSARIRIVVTKVTTSMWHQAFISSELYVRGHTVP
jgi:hypothetical protein